MHHGRDPKYLDKNYAGVFIVWDRMFGTFKQEEERPHYGVTKPLNSWNPVYANFAHYIDLAGYVRKARTAADALKILFYPQAGFRIISGFSNSAGSRRPHLPQVQSPAFSPAPTGLYPRSVFGALAVNSFYFFRSADFLPGPKSCLPFGSS